MPRSVTITSWALTALGAVLILFSLIGIWQTVGALSDLERQTDNVSDYAFAGEVIAAIMAALLVILPGMTLISMGRVTLKHGPKKSTGLVAMLIGGLFVLVFIFPAFKFPILWVLVALAAALTIWGRWISGLARLT